MQNRNTQDWFVYMLRCADDSIYTGISTDVDRRIEEHNGKGKKGAKALKGKRPVKLAWKSEKLSSRGEASKLEYALKKLRKTEKERIVQGVGPIPFKKQS
ncbi:MAG: GIY-YIG nuclease family protein [Planctomycetes bacterium]|nr:GIY-YIG nuclease family protein [Planctomycetota bacterium]